MSEPALVSLLNCHSCGVAHPQNKHNWHVRTATIDQLICNTCVNDDDLSKIPPVIRNIELNINKHPMIICQVCHKIKGSSLHTELCDKCHIENLTSSAAGLVDALEKQQRENRIIKKQINAKTEGLEVLREMNHQLIKDSHEQKLQLAHQRKYYESIIQNTRIAALKELLTEDYDQLKAEVLSSTNVSANSQASTVS